MENTNTNQPTQSIAGWAEVKYTFSKLFDGAKQAFVVACKTIEDGCGQKIMVKSTGLDIKFITDAYAELVVNIPQDLTNHVLVSFRRHGENVSTCFTVCQPEIFKENNWTHVSMKDAYMILELVSLVPVACPQFYISLWESGAI